MSTITSNTTTSFPTSIICSSIFPITARSFNEKNGIDIFSFLPLTFAFDLNDINFCKEIQNFSRYFNFVEYSNHLIANSVYQSHTEIEMDTLIRTAEKNIIEELQKGISKNKNALKRNSLGQSDNYHTTILPNIVKKDLNAKPHPVKIKETSYEQLTEEEKKRSDSRSQKDIKEVSPEEGVEVPNQESENGNINLTPKISHAKKPIENPALHEYRKILDHLKNFEFKIDLHNLPLMKLKSDDGSRVHYGTVRIDDCASVGKNIWILKVAGMNRGFGIEIFSALDRLKNLVKDISTGYQETIVQNNKKTSRSKGLIKTSRFVIQKYIEKPLLFRNRKFDLRVWVLIDQDMKLYAFKECYVRLSTEAYKLDSFEEKFVHLTNNALQKYSENYTEDETLKSAKELEDFVQATKKPDFSFKGQVWEKIKEMIRLVYRCSAKQLNSNNKNKSFEIFGYDFMIDSNLKTWLIEVNTNPSITTGGKILDAYIPRMIDDALRITVDKIFQPPKTPSHLVKINDASGLPTQRPVFRMEGYSDTENLWEFLLE